MELTQLEMADLEIEKKGSTYVKQGFIEDMIATKYCLMEEVPEVFEGLQNEPQILIPLNFSTGRCILGKKDYFVAKIDGSYYFVPEWCSGFVDGCKETQVFRIRRIKRTQDQIVMEPAESNPDSELVQKLYQAVESYFDDLIESIH
jgi:hypothetical protein